MRYLGGKAKIGKAIAAVIAPNGRPYYEPFCGALGVMRHIGYGVAADSDPEMIALWKAVQNGWQPPRDVSREEYHRVKTDLSAPPELRAFVKHACSFGGKEWGGYESVSHTAPDGRVYLFAEGARNEIAKAARRTRAVEFVCADYRALAIPDGAVVYCDPPYSGTTAMKGGAFDSAEFWAWAEALSQRCDVFVSEYSAPDGWREVWARQRGGGVHQHNAQKARSVERLFVRNRGAERGAELKGTDAIPHTARGLGLDDVAAQVAPMPVISSLRHDVVLSAAVPRHAPEAGTVRCAVCGHHWLPLAGCDVAAARADMHERGCGWCVGHLSASQLETFQLCPRKWGLAKIDGIREPESTAQRDGTAYHTVAEAYLATGRIDHSGKYGEWLSAAVPHLPTPPVPPDTIEQWFCFEPAEGGRFRGRVDLWLPGMILDHKTCADFKWAKTSDELATGIQSVLYAHAHLRKRPPGDSVLLRWVYARKRGASASIKVEATITKEQASDVFRRVHMPLARAIEIARAAETGNDLPPNPRACSAYGGCFYAAAGHCKLTATERTKALMTQGNTSTMAQNPDDLMNEIEKALAAPKGRIAKPKPATTVNRPKPAEEPAPEPATAPAPEPDADDEEAELLAQLAAKRAAKAAAAKAAEEALARAKAAAEAKIAAGTAAERVTVEPFDAIDAQCWIAVVAQSGDVALADSTVAALRLRRGV